MKVLKFVKYVVRRLRKTNVFMLHHVIDADKNTELVSSRVLSIANFLELCDKYQFSDLRYCTKGVFLTFDDGLSDFYNIVYPIIAQRRINVVLFMNVSSLDKPGYITTEQLREISQNPLITIGSHCVNHVALKTLTEPDKKFEIIESKKQLERIINKRVDYIAYPFGQYDNTVLQVANDAGYKRGFSAAEFELRSLKNRKYCIPRIDITNERVTQWI